MTKVLLEKSFIDAIEALRKNGYSNEDIIKNSFEKLEDQRAKVTLDSMEFDLLITALYVGYELKPTPEESVLDIYNEFLRQKEYVTTDAIIEVLNALEIQIEGINKR